MLPFNIKIAEVTAPSVQALRPSTSLDMFEGSTKNFHPDGLFSTTTFGLVGDEQRDDRFSYIDIKVPILHPIIYDRLIRLKGLYKDILFGRTYAIFDEKEKYFIASDEGEGDTGYSFFMSKWKELVFKRNDSVQRNQRIDVIEKYKDKATTQRILVLPAGMRDATIDRDGRVEQDEINKLYRKLISISNSIASTEATRNSPLLDHSRASLQLTFNEIYAMLKKMLEGKKGFLQQKWASRKLFYGTRNVITSMDVAPSVLGAVNTPTLNNTVVGLYQTMKMLEPLAIYKIRTMVETYFHLEQSRASLINRKTKKREWVELTQKQLDKWTTVEGAAKLINGFKDPKGRHKPVIINGAYLLLIYTDGDKFRIVEDIDYVPEHIDHSKIRPMTYAEMFYLSGYRDWYRYPMLNTRYPVATDTSTYPALIYTKTTVEGEIRYELGPNWEPLGDEYVAREFPKIDIADFHDTQVPHPTRLNDLGADFDGDTMSGNGMMTEEAIAEVNKRMRMRDYYVRPDGSLRTSISVLTLDFVIHNATGDYNEEG